VRFITACLTMTFVLALLRAAAGQAAPVGVVGATTQPAAVNDAAIWRPRMVTPAIVALNSGLNRQFKIEFRAPESNKRFSITLANDLQSWPCQVVSAVYNTIDRGTEPGWQIAAEVPADISPELFTLTVGSDRATATQPQAVSVCPTFDGDFYILHLSDEQIVNDKHTDPAGTYLQMVGTVEEMHWMQEPINLIHPRFCLVTGDQIDFNGALDGWNNWTSWGYEPGPHKHFSKRETLEIENRLSNNYIECHRGYRVPYVEAPGNHDVTPADKKLYNTDFLWHPISVQRYESYFGQRSWSFRMGSFYVLMHDWTEASLKDWAAADYARSEADPSVKFRLIGQHFYTDQAFVPNDCDLMLIGHGHKVETIKTKPYFIYEDGPTFKYGTAGFFNFRQTEQGWSCDQTLGERNVKKDVLTLFTDNGQQMKVRTDAADPMNINTESVTITNDLPQEFYDGRVRFVLPKGDYSKADHGLILSRYPCNDGQHDAVLVKVSIPANGTITVSIHL
jgi:hypothetical protein